MTWIHRRSKPSSNAEEDIQIELQRRGRDKAKLDYLETQKGFKFNAHKEGVGGTKIDFYWHPPFFYAVYIDGIPVHSSLHRQTKDDLITIALQKRGITVDRFRYTPPLPKYRRVAICDSIIKRLSDILRSKYPLLNTAKTPTLPENTRCRRG